MAFAPNCFKGKVVLVTGSSSGIGAEVALQFSSYGASVVITGRNVDRIREVAKKCRDLSSISAEPLQVAADILQESDAIKLISKTVDHSGRLDILINSAGIAELGRIQDTDFMKKYDDTFKFVRATVFLTKEAVPHLIKSKGSIVNLSSVASIQTMKFFTAYGMGNSAIDKFTQCLAGDLGPFGVRANCINPAAIKSPLFGNYGLSEEQIRGMFEEREKIYPLGRVGEVSDVANAIMFMALKESSFLSGVILPVDGGYCCTDSLPDKAWTGGH